MKKNFKVPSFTGMLLIATLLIFSCTKEESTNLVDDQVGEEVVSATELTTSDEMELISEEIIAVGEDIYTVDEILFTSKGSFTSDFLPDCVTITSEVTNIGVKKTIDFGDGCEMRNGNVLSGIIYLSYSKDMEAATKSLSMSLENFTFNKVAVVGGAGIERMRSNEDGNPQSHAEAEFVAEWPEGERISYVGNRTREWIEGYSTGSWGDNVFLITGMATYTGKLENVFKKEIVEPLRREMACRFIVSGILEISRNDAKVSLDFGDGECDSKGILTYPDGESKEIFLRRFHKKFPPKF